MKRQYNILVIESNFAERSRILRKFKEHQLKHTIHFVSNAKDALVELYYFNKEIKDNFPQLLLLDYSEENLSLLEKINSDERYHSIKVFLLIENNASFYKEKLIGHKINGIVDRCLDFKNFSNETFLDSVDLFLHLLRIGFNHNNRAKHLISKTKGSDSPD